MSNTSNSRINWADVLRAFAVYCVILAHLGTYSQPISLFCFGFIMQLFFFISGLFARSYTKLGFFECVGRILYKILLPHVFLCALNILYAVARNRAGWESMILECALAIRGRMQLSVMWFLPCYAVVCLLYWLLAALVRDRTVRLIICLVVSVLSRIFLEGVAWFWSANTALMLLFYYAMGDAMLPTLVRINYPKCSFGYLMGTTLLGLVGVGVGYVAYNAYNRQPIGIGNFVFSTIGVQLFTFVAAIFIIFALLVLAQLFQNLPLLQTIGKCTIATYALNGIGSDLMFWLFWNLGITWIPRNDAQVLAFGFGQCIFTTFVLSYPLIKLVPFLLGSRGTKKEGAST